MLISFKNKFIFIHIPKVAGVSIVTALGKYGSEKNNLFYSAIIKKAGISNKIIPNFLPKLKIIKGLHLTALEIKNEFGENLFNKYIKFAFVRNPWDWEVSHYHYILKTPGHPKHDVVKALKNFEEFVEYGMSKVSSKNPLKAFIYSDNGDLMVDYIGRFENLSKDFNIICKKIDVKNVKIPHKNKSIHKSYQSYYDERTIELVREHHKEDIELFGYDFKNRDLLSLL